MRVYYNGRSRKANTADTHIYTCSYRMFEPNVTLTTTNNPMIPELRCKGYPYNLQIRIGENFTIVK